MEKANRSKWQGGGFGLSGALKGAMMAGTLNAGSSVIRSFSDSSKANKDRNKILLLKKELLKEYRENSKIIKGLLECIFGCFNGVMEELVLRNLAEGVNVNEKEAIAIYNNTIKYETDLSNILENIFKAIIKYPYDVRFYEKLYEYDYRDEGLLQLVEFFGMTQECMYYKTKYEDIRKKKEKIYLEKRNFRGKVYESIEECNIAKKRI